MKIWFLQAVFAGLLTITSHDVCAEVDSTRLYTLPSVQVSSPKYGDLLSSTESKVVIKAEDYEGKGKSLPDIISETSGIQTRKFGGVGSFQTVSIRGMSGSKVLVYIDHVLLNNGDGGAVDLAKINMDQIDRIEIYKGITPAEFGGNSVGGVIHLISKTANRTSSFSAHSSYGSYATAEHSVSYTKPFNENLSLLANLSYLGSDNDFEYLDRNYTEHNTQDDFWTTRQNAKYWAIDGMYKLTHTSKTGRSTISISHAQNEGGNPGTESKVTYTAGYSSNTERFALNTEYNALPMIGSVLEWNASLGREQPESHWSDIDNLGYTIGKGYVSMGTKLYTMQTDVHLRNLNLKNQSLHTGILFDGGVLVPVSKNAEGLNESWINHRQTYTSVAEINSQWLKSVSTTVGYHHSLIADHTEGGISYFGNDVIASSGIHQYPAIRMGVFYQPLNWLNFYGNAASYYKHPGLMEIYGGKGGVLANFDLKAENGTNVELGVRLHHHSHYLEGTIFQNNSENAIAYIQSAHLIKPTNLAATRNRGIETNMYIDVLSWLQSESHLTWQEPLDVSNLSYRNKMILNEPKLAFNQKIKIGPSNERYQLEYGISYTSMLYRDQANTQEIPANFIHDMFLKYKVYGGLELTGSIRNLMDHYYEDVYAAYPYPGRQYFVGLSYKTGKF